MATESLYNYTIGFDTSGVKELQEEIEYNEKQLDNYEKKIKELRAELDKMAEAGETGSKAYLAQSKSLERMQFQADKYRETIIKLKNSSTYSFAQMQKSFMSLIRTVGLFAIVSGTIRRSLDFYEQAEQLDFLAQKTGIAAERLQELSAVSARYGGTTEGTVNSIENIRTNKEEYQKAGIRIEQDPSKTLENVARKMEKLKTDAEKWQLAETLGIDEATTRALIEGVDKYNESLQKSAKYKLYTKEDILRMREYRQIQQDIRLNMQNIYAVIYRGLLPTIRAVAKVLEKFTWWLNENQAAVKIAFTTAAVASLAIAFLHLATNMGKLATYTRIFGLLAAIGLIVTAVQDFVVFMEGGDSLFGRLWKKWGYDLDMIRNGVEIWIEQIKRLWNNLLAFFDKNRLHIDDPFDEKDINSYHGKDLTMEESKKLTNNMVNRSGSRNLLKYGKNYLGQLNDNIANSIPVGAISNYYGTQSQNETITKNAKNIANTNNRNLSIGQITINTQASDARAIAKQFSGTLDSLDNGQIG